MFKRILLEELNILLYQIPKREISKNLFQKLMLKKKEDFFKLYQSQWKLMLKNQSIYHLAAKN